MIGVTLDAGALIALEHSERRIIALLARAGAAGAEITVPASVLAQVMRDPMRQVGLSRLIKRPWVSVPPLDTRMALQVGKLLAASGTADVVDAHVVLCAREHDQSIVTSDPDDLARLDPGARLIVV
jgi:predicted nucleic acid-binding protein